MITVKYFLLEGCDLLTTYQNNFRISDEQQNVKLD